MDSSINALWTTLKNQQLVSGELPATADGSRDDSTPWYIALMQGFAGWVAAFFMLGFVGSVFGFLFRFDNEIALIASGLICCTAAYVLFRTQKKSIFVGQLGLVFSLTGQVMVAWGIFDWVSYKSSIAFFVLAGFQLTITVLMPHFIHRILSCWFAMIALFLGLNQLGIYGLGAACCGVLFTLVWINENHWKRFYSLWEPVGFGLALALVQFNGHILFSDDLLSFYGRSGANGWWAIAPWVTSALVAVSFALLLKKIFLQYQLSLSSMSGRLVILGGIFLVASGFIALGTSSALLILLVGFAYQRTSLKALGLLALLSFLSWYYYSLDTTLLVKSFILVGTGVVLLVGQLVVRALLNISSNPSDSTKENTQESIFLLSRLLKRSGMNRAKWISVGMMCLVLGAVNLTIFKKEQVLDSGKLVLLPLAPVDPRSLMQGDYMRLRFALQREAFRDKSAESEEGFILVKLDENSVGQFTGFYQGEILADNQVKMQYRVRDGKVKFATNAFFFQEGTANDYSQARYGEFRVASNGELLLNNLRDKDYKILGYNQP
ncbi:GDYXXLXY domain-containing protein [Neptunomonas sp.]|uniref:GDYXXLXY domain-containing protein n=1 Tax=Neptunomonas sp. TaxID=1971898 RepID=UPI0025E2D866|nr:GDYXXLXY domain-containing protein [Neptunomonas sp.]